MSQVLFISKVAALVSGRVNKKQSLFGVSLLDIVLYVKLLDSWDKREEMMDVIVMQRAETHKI